MALTSLTSLNSLTSPFAKVEYYIKVLLKLQKSPFRDSERTFRDSGRTHQNAFASKSFDR